MFGGRIVPNPTKSTASQKSVSLSVAWRSCIVSVPSLRRLSCTVAGSDTRPGIGRGIVWGVITLFSTAPSLTGWGWSGGLQKSWDS